MSHDIRANNWQHTCGPTPWYTQLTTLSRRLISSFWLKSSSCCAAWSANIVIIAGIELCNKDMTGSGHQAAQWCKDNYNRWELHTHWAAVMLCCCVLMPLLKNDAWKQTRNLFWSSLELNSIYSSNFYHRISSSNKGQEATGASSSCLGAKAAPVWTKCHFNSSPQVQDKTTVRVHFTVANSPTCMLLDCGGRPKNPERQRAAETKGEHAKCTQQRTARGIDTATFWLEGDSVHAMWLWNTVWQNSLYAVLLSTQKKQYQASATEPGPTGEITVITNLLMGV